MGMQFINSVSAVILLVITFAGHCSPTTCPISCPLCPCFTNGPYSFEIAENTSIGTSIATLTATGMDVVYSSTSTLFNMDPVTGVLTLGGPLDYEMQSTYQFRVEAAEGMYEGRSDVTIELLNVNEFAPQCTPNVVYLSVQENQAGVSYTLPNCADGDFPTSPTFSYEVTSFSDLFGIDANSLFTIMQQLDFESQDLYDIVITVNDTGIPPGVLSTTIRAIIAVDPVNEFPPFFTQTQFTFDVPESTVIGSVVGQVYATDQDGGGDGDVIYSSSSDIFTVNEVTGDIILTQTLDFEDAVSHVLTVTATDSSALESSRRTSTASVEVNVLDSNDQPPTFAQPVYFLDVTENTDPDTLLIQLTCNDLDTGVNKELVYSIQSGNDEAKYSIEPTSGNITLATNLNYDDPSNSEFFSLSIQCQEVVSPYRAAQTLLLIQVVSFNSFNPQPTNIEFEAFVPEDTLPGTALVSVEATDRDRGPGGVLRYYLNFGTSFCREGIISIDESSGVVYLISPLNYENGVREIYCIVTIWDSGYPVRPNEVDLYISVVNVNDEPPRCYPHVNVAYVAENATVGSTIYRLPCNDSDSNNLQYSLVSSQTPFRIESGGVLILDSALDFETEPFHLLQVQVSDGDFTANATVQIIVENINEHTPRFTEQMYYCSVREDTVVGTTLLCTFSATDQDNSTVGEVRYRLTASSSFSLTPEGELILSNSIDYEHQSEYLVEIEAYDLGTPSLSSTVTINITVMDANDNHPQLHPFIFESIQESAALGNTVTNVVCTDLDAGLNGEVQLEGLQQLQGDLDVTHLEPFQIDPANGEVTVNSDLDFETAQEYTLTIQCMDHGLPSLSSTTLLFISVLPVNEYPPQIINPPPSDLLIPERTAIGSVIYTLTASDQDGGVDGVVIFSLSSTSGEPAPFNINENSGEILLTAPLNCEQKTHYTISLSAQDNGLLSLSDHVNVTVNVTNCHLGDVVPEQFVYSMNVTENAPVGEHVGSVVCSSTRVSVHSDIEPMYRLVTESDYFQIDPTSGDIKLLISPDYEDRDTHHLTIECYDPNHPSRASNFSVFINILPLNEFSPEFQDSSLRVDVSEGTALGAMILQVQANDLDQGQDGEVLYSIESQHAPVVIDKHTGAVYLAASLDRESVDTLTLTISAQDASANIETRRSTTTTLTLSVTDVNDNWPQCSQIVHHLIVSPRTAVPHVLLNSFSCTDNDINENSDLQYEFSEDRGAPTDLFDVSSGALLLIDSLSVSGPLEYYLPITVRDGGTPSLATDILVIIDVQEPDIDANEEDLSSLVEAEGQENSAWIELHDLPRDLWERTRAEDKFQEAVAKSTTKFCALLPEACSLVSGCSGFFNRAQRKRSVPDSYTMFTEPSVMVLPDRPSVPTTDNTLSIRFYVALPTDANRSPNRETDYVVPGATLSLIVEENEQTIEAVVRDSVAQETNGTTYPVWAVAVAAVCGVLSGGFLAAILIACCVKYYQRRKKKTIAPVESIELRPQTGDQSNDTTPISSSKRESVTSELSGASNDAVCDAQNTRWSISRVVSMLKIKKNSEVSSSRTSRSTFKRESQSSRSGSSSAASNKARCNGDVIPLKDFEGDDVSTIFLDEDSERTSLENMPSPDRQGHTPRRLLRDLLKQKKGLDTPPHNSLPHTPTRPALRLSQPKW